MDIIEDNNYPGTSEKNRTQTVFNGLINHILRSC